MNNFYDAWHFLVEHPRFEDKFMTECLTVDVVKVNPKTKIREEDDNLNTETNVWLECGDFSEEGYATHEIALDCGADTFEEAIVKLANLVAKHYGTYTESYTDIAYRELMEQERKSNT